MKVCRYHLPLPFKLTLSAPHSPVHREGYVTDVCNIQTFEWTLTCVTVMGSDTEGFEPVREWSE